MLAQLQKLSTFALITAAGLWAWFAWRAGHEAWALAGGLFIVFAYALILGAEFALLARANRGDPAPAASIRALFGAWWAEVRTAPAVFCWRQPFRSQRWPDQAGSVASGQRGVVFVHGFVCNRGLWNGWLAQLTADGVPFVAVNLEPVFGSIDDYLPTIEAAIAKLERATGQPPVVVAHSMGGLALRHWWAQPGNRERLHHAITLGTPHRGTWLARFAISTNARQMRLCSPWLSALADAESIDLGRRITTFYSHCDNIVFPASTATFPGAENRHLIGTAHVHMADHPEPRRELMLRIAS